MNFNKTAITAGPLAMRSHRAFSNTLKTFYSPLKTLSPNQTMLNSSRSNKKVSWYGVPKLQKDKRQVKLKLAKDKIEKIKQTLTIQSVAQDQLEKRFKEDKLFCSFDFNPFSAHKAQRQVPKQRENIMSAKNRKPVSIIQVLKKNNFKKKLDQRYEKLESNFEQTHKYLRESMQKARYMEQAAQSDKSKRLVTIVPKIQPDRQVDECFELQRILAIKEENFFVSKRNNQDFCLFKFTNNPKNLFLQSSFYQLHKFKFTFIVAVRTSVQTISDPITRALSIHSRTSCIKGTSKMLPESFKLKQRDIDIKLQRLSTNDILLIASGQLNHLLAGDILSNLENQLKPQVQNNNSQIKVVYKGRQEHKSANIEDPMNQTDAKYWKNLQPTQRQNQQKERSTKYWLQIKEILKKQVELLNQTITSKSVHDKIQRQKELVLCKQIEDSLEEIVHKKKERKIRIDKDKSKIEAIKLNAFKNTMKYKNREQKNIRLVLRDASKSKSNSKNKQIKK